HRHAERANNQRDEADQAQEDGRVIDAARHRGITIPEIADEGVWQSILQVVLQLVDVHAWIELEQKTLRGAAAELDQTTAFQAVTADQHSHAWPKTRGQSVCFRH